MRCSRVAWCAANFSAASCPCRLQRTAPARSQDFKGQFWCERFFQVLVVLFGLAGFAVGYMKQDFRVTFQFLSAGGGISAVICLPDWPWWNRNPVSWIPYDSEEEEEEEEPAKPKKEKNKEKKKKSQKAQ